MEHIHNYYEKRPYHEIPNLSKRCLSIPYSHKKNAGVVKIFGGLEVKILLNKMLKTDRFY